MRIWNYIVLLIAAMIIFAGFSNAQSDTLNYQGNLSFNNQPANGTFDFEFRLFNASSGGTQISSTVTQTGVQVTNGNFTVSLLFDDAFDGNTRYLEISVRPAVGGSYTQLSPRRLIATVPYAMRSTSAFSADSATSAETANNAQALGGILSNQYVVTSDPRMTDARPPTPGSSNYIQNQNAGPQAGNFSINGNGNIGGNLIVGGNLSIPSTTRYLSIPGSAFLPTNDTVAYEGQGARWATGGSSAAFSVPVNLPDGANITEVRLIYFRGAAETISFSFRRFDPMTNTQQTIASGIGSSTSCPCSLVPTIGPFTTVNNQTYNYFALVAWNVNSQFPDAHKIQGLRITYTITTPLP